MAALTFEAYDENNQPRVFVGSFRPPIQEAERAAGYRTDAGCFIPTYHQAPFREAWQRGAYDRPLYAAPGAVDGAPTNEALAAEARDLLETCVHYSKAEGAPGTGHDSADCGLCWYLRVSADRLDAKKAP